MVASLHRLLQLDLLREGHAEIENRAQRRQNERRGQTELDRRYAARLYAVIIDRSTVLYDRFATDYPAKMPLLNVFQLNEGWHGELLPFPNVTNIDASAATAPIAPSDGGGPTTHVTHKTLDDSPAAQHQIEDAIMHWATEAQ